MRPAIPVEQVEASAYTVPTDAPEADGTFAWDDTTLVLVQLSGGGQVGTGWTYGSPVTAALVRSTLAPLLEGRAFDGVADAWRDLVVALRNIGRPGIGSMALSAVDCALWDLAARLSDEPLHRLLGAATRSVPLYGSGGFTSYDSHQLDAQLRQWLDDGFQRVKIKIGESWGAKESRDLQRVRQTRDTVGPDVEVYVDANGGYTRDQAIRLWPDLDELDVRWFEEPVSSDDLTGLAHIRPAIRADVAAGEYGYDLAYFRHLLDARAVDCVQVDVTRCGGISELLRIAHLAGENGLDVSGHCAPYQHAAALATLPNLRHLEWFHDHVRIEERFFDHATAMSGGTLYLSDDSPGNGLTWLADAAAPYRVF
jgi:L-alanine-DL-glutamate epimerase-like enolase superfamily enzyme